MDDLKKQLSSMQEQKYEACKSLESEWQHRLDEKSSEFTKEKSELLDKVQHLETKLRETNAKVNQGRESTSNEGNMSFGQIYFRASRSGATQS